MKTRSLIIPLIIITLLLSLCSPFLLFAGDDDDRDDRSDRFENQYTRSPIVKTANFPDPFVLEFTNVEKALRQGSPLLMSTAANREVLQYNRSQLADQQRAARDSIYGLSTATSGLGQLKSGLDATFAGSAAAGMPPTPNDLILKAAVEAQLQILQSQLSAQAYQAATGDKGYASGGTMSAGVAQMDDAQLAIIYSGYAYYHGYFLVSRQIERLEAELELLQRQLMVVTTLEELGRTTPQTSQAVQEGITALEQGLKKAFLEQASLLLELNLLLGRSAESTLEILPIPEPDLDAVYAINVETAWQQVYKQSYVVKAKRYTVGGLQEQYDDVVRNFGESGDRAWRAEQQLEGAKLDLNLATEQLRGRFDTFLERWQQNIIAYRFEQERLQTQIAATTRAELRYELGYLSEGDLLQSKNDLHKQQSIIAQAEDDLALTWQRWLLVLQGMDIGVGDR